MIVMCDYVCVMPAYLMYDDCPLNYREIERCVDCVWCVVVDDSVDHTVSDNYIIE